MIEVVFASQDAAISPDAVWVIQTPLHVPASGKMEIASIADAFPLDMPSGVYNLRFECFQLTPDAKPRVRFSLIRTDHPTFAVLRADSELRLSGELLRTASQQYRPPPRVGTDSASPNKRRAAGTPLTSYTTP